MEVGGLANVDEPAAGVSALSVLAPVIELGALRRRLAVVNCWPGIGRPLLELSFIHLAHWTIITAVPAPDGSGRPWPLNWPQLLFESNYDGATDDYLNTFADVVPQRLIKIWCTCFGFQEQVLNAPGADGRAMAPAAFRAFVDKHELDVLAYRPGVGRSVSALRQALAIERAERRANRLSGSALDLAQYEIERLALGPPSNKIEAREGLLDPLLRRTLRRRDVCSLRIVAPLEAPGASRVEPFRRDRRPLERFPAANFLRLSLLPRRMVDVGQPHPDVLPADYIVLSVDHQGSLDDYINAMTATRESCAAVDRLLQHCVACPTTDTPQALKRWIERHHVEPSYMVAGYRPCSPQTLRDAIEARDRVAARVVKGL